MDRISLWPESATDNNNILRYSGAYFVKNNEQVQDCVAVNGSRFGIQKLNS